MLKTKLLPVLAGLVLVGSIAGVGLASAQEGGNDGHTSFVQKLAEKLGVSEDKVKTAVDEIHGEHKAEMEKKLEERLIQAVKDGKITEAQKQAILKKFQEEKPFIMRKSNGMTPEKEVMEQKRQEHEAWAKENGLTPELLRELHGGPHKVKFFMP